jgi:alpha-ketoglutarate-dependent 2,4-dichlorophenoxyacetate dioxygenase
MDNFGVMVFHDQRLTDETQMAFSRNFGELELASHNLRETKEQRLGAHINDISNLDANNNVLARDNRRRLFSLGTRLWHSDSSFKVVPAKYSLLSARVIPSAGGNTEFADMRAAYDALDDETKAECEGLVCEHSQLFSRAQIGFGDFTEQERQQFAPVQQRLIRRHPSTGRKSLYLASHAGTIVGWPVPEARAFLRDLIEHATQRKFVYSHEWKQFDLVIWDNQATMHRARPFDATQPRDMHRTTVAGTSSTMAQAA